MRIDTVKELDPNNIARWGRQGQLNDEAISVAQAAAREIEGDPARKAQFAAALTALYDDSYEGWSRGKWREFVPEEDRVLSLLLMLAAVPRALNAHQASGVAEEITLGVLWDMSITVHRHRSVFGTPGVERSHLSWFRLIADGSLYRIGRLEYMPKAYDGESIALRHRESGQLLALAPDDWRFGPDGLTLIGDADEATFTSRQNISGDACTGNPVMRDGRTQPHPATFPFAEWEIILHPGDPVLEIHIPGSGPLTVEETRDSLCAARNFFARLFPETQYGNFVCHSWLLNLDLAEMLPADSNMVRFLRGGYSLPVQSGTRSGLYFVYGTDDVDPVTAPRDTRLRAAMMTRLDANLPLRSGAMFWPVADAEKWGLEKQPTL